ncbi:MAG TPA: phospholipase A, partial [Burkholderiales bacterium]|nr:phospholipase A [Burkholderiales bacterium]
MIRFLTMLALAFLAGPVQALSFQDCLNMETSDAPLKEQRDCYKSLAKKAEQVEPVSHDLPKSAPKNTQMTASDEQRSILLSEWDPEKNGALSMYRQSYFLPVSNSSNPNNAPTSPNPNNRVPYAYPLDNTETKFQFSFKTKLWNIDNRDWAMWFGYTQQSFWQFW